jgi:hypothetical protein
LFKTELFKPISLSESRYTIPVLLFLVADAFSPVVMLDSPAEEEPAGSLESGELLLPDVPLHEPGGGQSLHQLGRTVRQQVGKLLPKLGSKQNKKYKEKPATSAC